MPPPFPPSPSWIESLDEHVMLNENSNISRAKGDQHESTRGARSAESAYMLIYCHNKNSHYYQQIYHIPKENG